MRGKFRLGPRAGRCFLLAITTALLAMAGTSVNAAAAGRPTASSTSANSVVTDGYDNERSGYNPAETTLTNANASGLEKLWSYHTIGAMNAQPVEAAGVLIDGTPTNVVYEGTQDGMFYALNASTGALIWRKYLGSVVFACPDVPNGRYGIGGAAAISFTGAGTGVVYVESIGATYALDLATGAEEPGWPVKDVLSPKDEIPYGGLTLQGNLLYTTSSSECDVTPNHGGIVTIDTQTASVVSAFFPTGKDSGGGIWGPGGVSVDPSTGNVFAATANANLIDSYGYGDAMVELSPTLQVLGSYQPKTGIQDDDFGTTPILFQPTGCPYMLVGAKQKSGEFYVSEEGDEGQIEQQLQIASITDWQFNGIPAWDPQTQMLYISNSSDSAPYTHGMVALQANPDCSLSLAWEDEVGPNLQSVSPPTIAGGVVYYGDGPGNTEYAFDAATGAQLWNSGSTIGGGTYATPMVDNGELFVPSWDNNLYAFAPSTSATAAAPRNLAYARK